jgi:P-type Cu+ transporter
VKLAATAPERAGSTRVDLPIQGMTCAACAARIERGLNRLDGVASASVNLAAERATVVYDPAVTGRPAFEEKVAALGYAVGRDPEVGDSDADDPERAQRSRLLAAAALAAPVLLLGMLPALQYPGWAWLAAVLATPVVLWAGSGFHRAALAGLRHRAATMDTLVSLGTLAAWGWSVAALLATRPGQPAPGEPGGPHLYFEVAAIIVVVVLFGRWLEQRARRRSGQALRRLLELGSGTAMVLRDGAEVPVPVEQVAVGDRFVVRPGQKLATDGVVEEGRSSIDRSLLTGESVPVAAGPGDGVIGATVNLEGRLVVPATRVGADTALAQIVRLVEAAQAKPGARRPWTGSGPSAWRRSCSPATTRRRRGPWPPSSASIRSRPSCPRTGRWPRSAAASRPARSWPWSATASTTPPPWPRPTSAWPSAAAPTWPSRPAT